MSLNVCEICTKELENTKIDSNQWERLECKNCSSYKMRNKITEEIFYDVNFIDEQISKTGREYEEYLSHLIEIQKNLEKILENIGESDTRITRGVEIGETISMEEIPDKLKEYFDISEEDLISQENIERFNYECKRLMMEREIRQCRNKIESLEKKQYKSIDIVHQVQSMSIETKIVSDSTSVEIMSRQFKLFSKLELKLRECIKKSLKNESSWWDKLVPDSIKRDVKFYNHHDPEINELMSSQDFKLLEKMTFKNLQMIITGQPIESPNWDYFKNIFPDYYFANTRLRECNNLRNKGPYHTHTLDSKQEKTLENNTDELIGYINEYLK